MLYLLSSEERKYLIADYKRSKLSFLSSGEEINNLCRRTKAKGVIFILYYPEYLEFDIRYLDAKIGPEPVNDEILTCAARYVYANNQDEIWWNVVRFWVWNTLRRIEVPKDDKITFRLWENVPDFLPPVSDCTSTCEMLPETMEEWMGLWFDVFNMEYFEGTLPIPQFAVKPDMGNMGEYDSGKNKISLKYDRTNPFLFNKETREEWQEILIHEMIHEYQKVNHLPLTHGKAFMEKANEIDAKGGWHIGPTQITMNYIPRHTTSREQFWWIVRQSGSYIVYSTDKSGEVPQEMEKDRGQCFHGTGVLYQVNSVFPAPNIWFDKEFKKYVLPILKAGKRLSERDPMFPELP